jgi:hypothetical protein
MENNTPEQKPPQKEKFGWEETSTFDSQGGWTIEGGEEAYYEALAAWEHIQHAKPMDNKEKPLTLPETDRIEFAKLKYQIGQLLAEKFLEYNEGKFHTALELNPATHTITDFVFEEMNKAKKAGYSEAMKEQRHLFVEYAGFYYRVADFSNEFGVQWVHIYDEPPSLHIDRVKFSSTTGIKFSSFTEQEQSTKEDNGV